MVFSRKIFKNLCDYQIETRQHSLFKLALLELTVVKLLYHTSLLTFDWSDENGLDYYKKFASNEQLFPSRYTTLTDGYFSNGFSPTIYLKYFKSKVAQKHLNWTAQILSTIHNIKDKKKWYGVRYNNPPTFINTLQLFSNTPLQLFQKNYSDFKISDIIIALYNTNLWLPSIDVYKKYGDSYLDNNYPQKKLSKHARKWTNSQDFKFYQTNMNPILKEKDALNWMVFIFPDKSISFNRVLRCI
jgi:hypothetical protein